MAQPNMQLTDWLDDLSVRFIVNLPLEELESMERICFQIEEAQWFYEDFVRPLDPNLPSLNLRQFSMKIFQHCPLFSAHGEELHAKAFSEFMVYKTRVPVRGAIILNEAMDQVILVKGWKKGASWSFPRGKINKDEEDIDCAIREVYEETGFDVNAAGLATEKASVKSIEVTMREQHMRLFVFAGISMDTHFEPRTRKEISAIQWYKLSELPTLKKVKNQQDGAAANGAVNSNKFYMVAPFVRPLKRIISELKKERAQATPAPAMLEPLDAMSPALPEQVTDFSAHFAGNDMNRLMAQLRQSSQASREANYPEVSNLQDAQQAASVRENKANAMLSLLRSGQPTPASYGMNHPPPQTPLEQMIGHPSQAPPSPRSHAVRQPRSRDLPAPPVFEVSPEQVPQQYVGQNMHRRPPPLLTTSIREQQNLLPSFLRDSSQTSNSHPASAPYHSTGDPTFSQVPGALGSKNAASVPHASRLPPPKLNAHSSTLLNLFKSGASASNSAAHTSASLVPADEPTRPELSPSSVTTFPRGHGSQSGNVTSPAMLSSTPALVSPASGPPGNDLKRSNHQETLLSLFRQPKPSPSLVPARDPVELSAQGSPTHSRMPSDFAQRREKTASRANAYVEPRIPRGLELASSDGRVAATISGPLNVPQFDRIFQNSSAHKAQTKQKAAHAPEASQPQQPVKILSRPTTAIKSPQPVDPVEKKLPQAKKSPQKHKDKAPPKDAPFQPRILKRPETALQIVETQQSPPKTTREEDVTSALQPALAPISVPAIANPTAPILDRRNSQTQDQKAALLSLFGKSTAAPVPSPAAGRRGSVVSPLSEKPPAGSALPSPLGIGKPRMSSIAGERSALTRNKSSETTHTVASPVDKKFLLGYLDSVASQGRS